jgi:superfamily II DNA or RNA helicase
VSVYNCDPKPTRPNRYKEDWDNVIKTLSFRAKQDECLINISSHECGIIQAPTGFGKGTLIAMVCLLYPNAKIHVITPSKDLVEKTVATLLRYLPNIGQVGCNKKRLERVTVFSADSLHLSDGDADIILADEIHELAAPTYAENLAKYRFSRNFGFSATPEGRADGADANLESLFGEKIFVLTYPEAVALNLVVPIIVEWLDIRLPDNPAAGKQDTPKKRWGIWRNELRNKILADRINSIDPDDQTLVLVETVEHLMFLRSLLPDFEACYSEQGLTSSDVRMYRKWGLMGPNEEPITTKQREHLRKSFEQGKIKKAIATSVWATGVDFEQLAVLVRADALASTIMDTQAPGRVSRIDTTDVKPYGLVIDCMDQFDQGFRRKALGRRKNYVANE